jgi:hypothetical protein
MYIVAIGWLFVVICMAAAEATSSSIAGALVTLLIYGLLPLGLFLWLVGTPQRRRNREGTRQTIGGASFTPGRRFKDRQGPQDDAD